MFADVPFYLSILIHYNMILCEIYLPTSQLSYVITSITTLSFVFQRSNEQLQPDVNVVHISMLLCIVSYEKIWIRQLD